MQEYDFYTMAISWSFFVIPIIYEYTFINNFNDRTLVVSILFASYSLLLYSVGMIFILLFTRANIYRNNYLIGINIYNKVIPIICISYIISYFYINNIDINFILNSNWDTKRDFGFQSVIITWICCILSGQALWSFYKSRYIYAITSISIIILILIFFRSRALIATIFIPILIYVIIISRPNLIWAGILSIVAILLVYLVRAARYQGSIVNALDTQNLFVTLSDMIRDTFVSGELSMYRYFLLAIEDCGDRIDCFQNTSFISIISKFGLTYDTQRFEYYLYDFFIERDVGGSLHPTLFGYIYGDYGWILSAFVMIFFGAYCAIISRIAKGVGFFLIVGFFANFSIFFVRGSVYNAFIVMNAGILFYVIVRMLMAFSAGSMGRRQSAASA